MSYPSQVSGNARGPLRGKLAWATTTTSSGTRTPAQIATDINALSGFSAVAVAYVRNGRVWIETLAGGSAASVEVKTVANSGHTTLGFPLAAYTGKDKRSIRVVLTNTRTTTYA